MWIIKQITEADFGCEERLPGEPLKVLVTLECDDGRMTQFEVADQWLIMNDLNEGDEWPEDTEAADLEEEQKNKQQNFMNNYYDALEELDQ